MTAFSGLLRFSGAGLVLAVAGAGALQMSGKDWRTAAFEAAGLIERADALILSGYQRAPAVVIGLAVSLVLPVIAMLAMLWRRITSRARRLRELQSRPDPATTGRQMDLLPAWLVVDSAGGQTVRVERELLSIGREQDNDVQIADPTIHRYHALVQRTPEAGYVITDVSGPSGQGIRVNGTRIRQARLRSGDQIHIGRVSMTFARDSRSRAAAAT